MYILKGPFPLGEPAIAKDAEYSYNYAKWVLKDRFELGEPAIKKHPLLFKEYAERFLK